jgi:serralysin
MDIFLTDGDDTYVQSAAKIDEWNGYFGKNGNDIIKVYQGGVLGGAGNDRIEKLASAEWWRVVSANYWESPGSITVDLAGGWADDGYGTRDTLIGVRDVNGGWNGAVIYGDAQDNEIGIGGGDNVIDGRGGADLLRLPVFNDETDIARFTIAVSTDGQRATITHQGYPNFKAVVSNVERISVGYTASYSIADFIKPDDMAVQGLLAGDANRWNAGSAMGSAVQISFSFMAQAPAGAGVSGFAAIAEAQRPVFRTILDSVARLTGATFLEVADSAASNLRFGASAQAATKGLAAMPGETNGGQVWMDIESLLLLTPGSEGYAALLHEIGHALGLRHPRNVEAGDKYDAQWRAEDDQTSLSVMSQNASPDGLYPSTWSAYDITALRALYGSGAQANPGDTRYVLGEREFGAQTSIVDDAGIDTIDARLSVTGVAIDLAPGHVSSVGVTAAGIGAVGNLSLATATWIENASGSAYDDVIKGNALDNILTGGKGNDWLDGAAGIDTASFAGKRGDYLVSSGFGKLFVTARDGVSGFDTLLGIEKLLFADGAIVLGSSAFGADLAIEVDQNASVGGVLPEASDSLAADVSYTVAKGPANGTLALAANGSYTYTPRPGFSSSDSFSYTLADKNGGSNVYTGYITVRAISATISGGGADDSVAGSAANDIIDAGAGNDRITGSAGSDGINGGAGLDTLVFSQARAGLARL